MGAKLSLKQNIFILVAFLSFGLLTGCNIDRKDAISKQTIKTSTDQEVTQQETTQTDVSEKKKVVIVSYDEKLPFYVDFRKNVIKVLKQKGYEEGVNLEVVVYDLESGDATKYIETVAAIKNNVPDVVVTDGVGNVPEKLVQPLLDTGVQIVMGMQVNCKTFNFIESEQKSGGNVTGLTNFPSDLFEQVFIFLNELAPLNGKKLSSLLLEHPFHMKK